MEATSSVAAPSPRRSSAVRAAAKENDKSQIPRAAMRAQRRSRSPPHLASGVCGMVNGIVLR